MGIAANCVLMVFNHFDESCHCYAGTVHAAVACLYFTDGWHNVPSRHFIISSSKGLTVPGWHAR